MSISKSLAFKLYEENEKSPTLAAKAYLKTTTTSEDLEAVRKRISGMVNKRKRREGLEITTDPYHSTEISHSLDKGTLEISSIYSQPPTPEIIIKDHKLDTKKWKLSRFWSKQVASGWRVSALFSDLPQEQKVAQSFGSFLQDYKPKYKGVIPPIPKNNLPKGTLFINKQDAHLNKKDEASADNDIFDRFDKYFGVLESSVEDVCKVSKLEKALYVIGSDHFNSEITGMTVRGTPQTNILTYHTSFQLVCDHEVKIIDYLLSKSDKVDVIYLIGNHDACVSFHMASWLRVYFRDDKRVNIDISPEYTKYLKVYDSIICINHGDVQKPEKLAQNFAYETKEWIKDCNYSYIITGDKHHELSKDFGAIKWYQIAASSTAKSNWDKQCGHTTTPALMTTFLLRENEGASLIVKKKL